MRGLPDDLWVYDEPTQLLSGRRTQMSFRLAQQLDVRLAEASPPTGAMVFDVPPVAVGSKRGRRR